MNNIEDQCKLAEKLVKGRGFTIFDARIGHRQRIEVDFFDGNGELHCFAVQRFLNTTDEALIQDVERQLILKKPAM